ncbi:DUF3073 domain-containing protein [Thermasporomyces composti]|jgi:hypothetical protein|uniref:DUF3073 family protein n=1 Tax=Thermasporomyces composti TaxID=696763 RepID=A0A3D9V5E8_THECX|nr:DUF3073 domain-containing protein [Thermasporomyces composti]REF36689.1 DUF3073 family protein [Thermasporomyces composti]
MGRGRAKAKQTKVARALKYRTHDPDFEALQRELSGRGGKNGDVHAEDDPYDEYDDGVDEDDRVARRR